MNKMDSVDEHNDSSSARQFVDLLLSEGVKTACDSTNESFKKQGDSLPPYFDKILFKRGQDLYKKYTYSLDLVHAFGVLILYSIPTALNVLLSAFDSSFNLYNVHATQLQISKNIQSMYYTELEPTSSDWKLIKKIKLKHNGASNRSSKKGLNPLTQLDMAVAQFAMLGLGIIRGEFFGLQNVSNEDWNGFHHYWRVMGYLIGIDERFNICSPSLETTKKIAELLVKEVISPEVDKKCPVFLNSVKVASLCFKPMLPELDPSCTINFIINLLKQKGVGNIYQANYVDMNWFLAIYYKYFVFSLTYMLKWRPYRIIRNIIHRLNMFLITKLALIPKLECTLYSYIYL